MQDFPHYFQLGWQHILDWQGYHHILFVMALCGTYTIMEWKKVLILITAFTIGHGITLVLSVFNVISVKTPLIEFLIPVTILITATANILSKRQKPKSQKFKYTMALFFALLHGLGFSNYLKSLSGKTSSITAKLFAFNIGLEFGQVLIIAGILILSFILIWLAKIKRWDWNFFLSSAIFGISFIMAAERFPALLA